MKTLKLFVLTFAVVFATACKDNKKEEEEEEVNTEVEETVTQAEEMVEAVKEKKLSITLSPKSDSKVEGTINFTEKDGMVTMVGTVTGLEEGEHAIHIHEKADCSAADGTSSGGHWNPTGQPHGEWGAETGYHKGDIGNLTANANGRATITKTTDEWCIGCGDETKDILGKAIIVHLDVDDFTTQPTGNAGARVGCAGIIE
ncbi:Cu-Zn family superoxide dismutase [Winogradskyella epiphytica]|uniref:Superoxide dismutase [Cu-Zn] n=1 Tax=Winogradskyella epiphytica TaxID=262005 RepID=A0A2V4XSJ7_9FLAO|nr:superoxide dismutase family protein [Winogradskyella epiphytica]PYE81051.1 Cu-Zn family superoxide dismutase [Winogradskyella epiphytica]GGW66499.1 superoxide dismutase [Cu-Zn] [Winogradskyella epiphytica]